MSYTAIGEQKVGNDFYTLGCLMDLCKKHKDKVFRFIDTDFSVVELCSWRGSYNIPQITYGLGLQDGNSILSMLEKSISQIHHGYKGGEYKYHRRDEFYVSTYGRCMEYKVKGYEIKGDEVILITDIDPY